VLTAVSRYGGRFVPNLDEVVEECRRRGQLSQGPCIAEFEEALARRLGGGRALTTSYGRMAAYSIFKALELPPGSEIVFPALTFWVVPEMARAAGYKVVFADVDPATFNLDPASLERAIGPRTRALVPTHIYGLPCDMDAIMAIARRHHLKVVEDCAHTLGATYHGQPVGTFGDAAFFSFQLLKPLNTLGGGAAFTRDPALAERLAALVRADPWPTPRSVLRRARLGKLERFLTSPAGFTLTAFPLLWAASWLKVRPDAWLWEKIRSLRPLPGGYHERYSNMQAALGLAGLERLVAWNETTRAHARLMSAALADVPCVGVPPDPSDRVHLYYQYCLYVPDREALVQGCLRRGLDIEYHHMDICSDLPLFEEARCEARGARRTADAVQIPIHAALDAGKVAAVARRLRHALVGRAADVQPSTARLTR